MNARKQLRQEEAAIRQAAHDSLTFEQKLAKALARPGSSAREVAKLTAAIAKEKTA
jgi:hypothetical protein